MAFKISVGLLKCVAVSSLQFQREDAKSEL